MQKAVRESLSGTRDGVQKEIASKVIGVVVRFLLLVVIAIPSKGFVRCPQ